MMKLRPHPAKWLEKKARKGVGHPIGTIAFYRPDDRRATKVAVGILQEGESEPSEMRRFFIESGDARTDSAIMADVVAFLKTREVRNVAMVKTIIGCPHKEAIDYPYGQECPHCPFWIGRDRWAGVTRRR
jgi:hypothetical protein